MASIEKDDRSDISSFDPSRPNARAQIAGLIFAHLLIDKQGHISEANQAAEEMLGCSAKRLVGKPLIETIGPLDPRVEDRLAAGDAALVARDVRVMAVNGEQRVNMTMSPLPGNPGWRIVTMSMIGHEENSDNENLPSSSGAPSILAHEIKNPLAAIRGAGQLAARKLPLKDKKLGRMIMDEVDRIARLIDRMQQLGSETAETLSACNPHEAIRSAIATVRTASATTDGSVTSVTIREEFDPSLPAVMSNRDVLEQVLINLVSNARDAAGAGATGEVIVRTRFVSGLAFSAIRLGRAVRLPIEITVTDNGPGIPAAMRDHVFEPFVSSKPSGQGLGLALVRKLVRDMNGTVSHDRDTRNGLTNFRVHLPLAKQAQNGGSK